MVVTRVWEMLLFNGYRVSIGGEEGKDLEKNGCTVVTLNRVLGSG